jgi:thioredoxin 1
VSRATDIALAAALVVITACGSVARDDRYAVGCTGLPRPFVQELEDAGDTVVLAVFWATWSAPDRLLMSSLDAEIAGERDRWIIRQVDVDREMPLAEACNVSAVPTLIAFVHGTPVDRLVGAAPRDQLRTFLESIKARNEGKSSNLRLNPTAADAAAG